MKHLSSSPILGPLCGFLLLATISQAQESFPPEPTLVSLSEIVGEITANYPELKFYEAEIAAAKAGLRIAGTYNNPELSLDLGRRRVTDPVGVLAGEGTAWGVSISQRFEWPGRLALRKAVANRQLELAELGLARFKLALEARARYLAYSLHSSAEKSAAVREVADRFAALKETFLARDPAGVTPLLETRVIEAQELALQRRATETELAAQAALIELNQLRGASPSAVLRTSAPKLVFNPAPEFDVVLAAAHENNFDFRARKVELEQQGFAVRLAQNERYPSFSVSPYYSQARAGDKERNFGIELSIPLPISSRARGLVEFAKARQNQAEVAVLVAQRELDRSVITAAQSFRTKVAESQRWSPEAAQKFREAADLADRHYRLGAVPIATYVELQNSYLDAVEALFDTKIEALQAGLELQQLTGLDFKPVEIAP